MYNNQPGIEQLLYGQNAGGAFTSGSLNIGAAPQPIPTDTVRTLVIGLGKRIEAIDVAVSELNSRLAQVLTPEPPSGNASGSAIPQGPPCSDLTHELRGLATHLDAILGRLTTLRNRVEL